jgi:hypothetical protein
VGATLRKAHLKYDVARDVATAGWIMEAFPTGESASPGRSPARQVPIFIVGLPRSGTTLVERILSSHSSVYPAGELDDFALALVSRVKAENGTAPMGRSQLVNRSAHIDFEALGDEYLSRASATVGSAGCFTDKMPLNYLYCGLIRRALPNAKIIHLTRHPMAAGYAMYKTLFKDGYPFSYDLTDIGRYYVADPLIESRKLLAHCGLDWQDSCAEFHRNPNPTTTASASQVRLPLYESSVSQWRHYETELRELREILEGAGISTAPQT